MYQDSRAKDVGNAESYQLIKDEYPDRETYNHNIRSTQMKETWTFQ